jgi:hypothetical protein
LLYSPQALEAHKRIIEAETRDCRIDERRPRVEEREAADAHMRELGLITRAGERTLLGPPDSDKLARHIKLYGYEGVEEVVRAFPTDSMPLATYRTDAPSGRRMTGEMKNVILSFSGTHPLSAIANTLNISERRVKELLAASA